jgi:hypothetical protein
MELAYDHPQWRTLCAAIRMFHLGKYQQEFDGIWNREFTRGCRLNLFSILTRPALHHAKI